jgi:ferredoxin
MAHHTLKSGYEALSDRLNRFPQGAPPSELLFRILRLLVDEREAGLLSLLPLKPFTATQAARRWNLTVVEAQKTLDALADRAMLVDMEGRGNATLYVLPPPMAGFFEFSLMRTRGDLDQKLLSELFYEYITRDETFIRALFTDGTTQLGRIFVHETALADDNTLHVLDYERASEVVATARHMGVGLCFCRHKMQHLGRACDAPQDICMTFGTTADSLIRHGHARRVGPAEGLDLLQQAREGDLVQFGENVQRHVSFICNCCGCCCEAMLAAKRFAILQPVHTTSYLPSVTADLCTGCGNCVGVCPVAALSLEDAADPARPKRRRAVVDEQVCLGCGVCVRHCAPGNLQLKRRAARVITPATSAHRYVAMAVERGKLQHFIWDNRALWSHRALAAVFGAILNLPPVKRTLAREQVRSRYLDRLLGLH